MKLNDFTLKLLGYSAERDDCIGAPSRWASPPTLVVDTPLLDEMIEVADELWKGPSRLVWHFLVGGPGNGKSEAVGAFVRRLNELARRDGYADVITPQEGRDGGRIPYWFVGNLRSESITVLQDISVPRNPGSDPAEDLLAILDVSSDVHILACANRGMLLRAYRSAKRNPKYQELASVLGQIDKRSQEDATPEQARWTERINSKEVDVRVWPLDHESVLFGESVENPWADGTGSVIDQVIERASAPEKWEDEACAKCPAAQLCPLLADAKWLRDGERRRSLLRLLRRAEVLSAQRIVLREALGLVSLMLVGSPSDFGDKHPCDWVLERVTISSVTTPSTPRALLELISHRVYQDLFGRAAPTGLVLDQNHGERDAWVLEGMSLLNNLGVDLAEALREIDSSAAKGGGPQRLIGDVGILSVLDPAKDIVWCQARNIIPDGRIADLRSISAPDQSALEQFLGDLLEKLQSEAASLEPHKDPAKAFAALYRWASTLYLRLAGTATGDSPYSSILDDFIKLLAKPFVGIGPTGSSTTLREVMQAVASSKDNIEIAKSFSADLPTLRLQPEGARPRSSHPRWPANDRLTLRVFLPGQSPGPPVILTASTFINSWRKHIEGAAEWNIPPAMDELMRRWRDDFAVSSGAFKDIASVRYDGDMTLEFEFVPGDRVQVRVV